MESKAHYVMIGSFVLLFFFAGLAFTAWLSGSNLDQDFDEYVISFEGPIRGIGEASEVRFNGIKVGEVTQVRLNPDNPNLVLVRVEVFQETPVDIESFAQLEPQGLTGLNFIQISSGGTNLPLAKDSVGKELYVIEGRRSQVDMLLDDSGSVVESIQKTLGAMQKALNDESTDDLQRILSNIEAITAAYREDPLTATRIEKTLSAIDEAAAKVGVASDSVDQTAKDAKAVLDVTLPPVLERFQQTLGELDNTLIAARTLAERSTVLVDTANGSLNDVSAGTLKELEDAAQELKRLMETLNRVADDLETNPTKFIIGEKREIVEMPQ